MKKGINILKEYGINRICKVSGDSNHSTKGVAAWVNNEMTRLSSEFENFKGDATKTVAHDTITVKKNVENGLSRYYAKAAEVI